MLSRGSRYRLRLLLPNDPPRAGDAIGAAGACAPANTRPAAPTAAPGEQSSVRSPAEGTGGSGDRAGAQRPPGRGPPHTPPAGAGTGSTGAPHGGQQSLRVPSAAPPRHPWVWGPPAVPPADTPGSGSPSSAPGPRTAPVPPAHSQPHTPTGGAAKSCPPHRLITASPPQARTGLHTPPRSTGRSAAPHRHDTFPSPQTHAPWAGESPPGPRPVPAARPLPSASHRLPLSEPAASARRRGPRWAPTGCPPRRRTKSLGRRPRLVSGTA